MSKPDKHQKLFLDLIDQEFINLSNILNPNLEILQKGSLTIKIIQYK
jgi:hypothetical protein